MLNNEALKNYPREYSKRVDGKINVWVQVNELHMPWFDHDEYRDLMDDRSGFNFDYRKWIVVDVIERMPDNDK